MTTTPATTEKALDLLRLDRQICFTLNTASRAFGGLYRELLKDLGLTYPQYLAMLVLWENGPLPVKRLGELLRLETSTLSPLIKRLETFGYVRRERSTEDERSVTVVLTPTGAALRDKAVDVPPRIIAGTGLTPTEIDQLHDLLTRATTNLDTTTAAIQ
jgi:DNA-binding MarR family transcriptional regulator